MRVEDFNPVITPSDKEALRQGYRFDPVKADRPVQWIEKHCRLSTGDFADQPMILLDWQKQLLWRVFGWVDVDGRRRHREVFCEVPKKNGKSGLVSAIVLYLLTYDGEARPKIHVNATDKAQASLIWEEADQMIQRSPDLAKRLESSEHYKRIRYRKNGGIIQTCSSDVDSKDGGNCSAVIFDELHRFTGNRRAAWNVYAGSGAARRQPLKISISTAGEDRNSVMFEQHNRALKIETGELVDVSFCGVVFGPREGVERDPHDEATWRAYNPSLGHTMDLKGFRADYESARLSPESFNYWKRTRLNIWTQSAARFIDADQWAACEPRRPESEIVEAGELWFAGLDLSSTRDITAFVRTAGNPTHGADVFLKAWMPEEEAERRQKQHGIKYREWADAGFLTLTPGNRIDYDEVIAGIEEDFDRIPFLSLHGDHYNASLVGAKLLAKGLPFAVIRQGFLSLNSPTKEVERLVAIGKLRHGDNPVLTWTASNCVAVRDKSNNVMLDKSKSHEKIDPMAALVNSIAGMIDHYVNEAKATAISSVECFWVPAR